MGRAWPWFSGAYMLSREVAPASEGWHPTLCPDIQDPGRWRSVCMQDAATCLQGRCACLPAIAAFSACARRTGACRCRGRSRWRPHTTRARAPCPLPERTLSSAAEALSGGLFTCVGASPVLHVPLEGMGGSRKTEQATELLGPDSVLSAFNAVANPSLVPCSEVPLFLHKRWIM